MSCHCVLVVGMVLAAACVFCCCCKQPHQQAVLSCCFCCVLLCITTYREQDTTVLLLGSRGVAIPVTHPAWPSSTPRNCSDSVMMCDDFDCTGCCEIEENIAKLKDGGCGCLWWWCSSRRGGGKGATIIEWHTTHICGGINHIQHGGCQALMEAGSTSNIITSHTSSLNRRALRALASCPHTYKMQWQRQV